MAKLRDKAGPQRAMNPDAGLRQALIKSVWYMTDPWTLINCETQEPVLAMDAAGFPSLVFSSRRDAEESARAHAELWGIDCYPARLRVAG